MVTPPEIQGCVEDEEEEEEEEEDFSYSAGDAACDLDGLAFGAQASAAYPALARHSPFFARGGKSLPAASPSGSALPLEARSLPLAPPLPLLAFPLLWLGGSAFKGVPVASGREPPCRSSWPRPRWP